jgi:hypothetical protein
VDPGPAAGTCRGHLTDSNFAVHFEAAAATIRRDWFDPNVFGSQAWRWNNAPQAGLLSDGGQDSNAGSAPLFPSSVLMVRALTISGPALLPCLPYIRQAVNNQETVGFGPFTIAGTSSSQSPYYLPPILTTTSIHVVYPQVVAYGVTALPKTPNPNPDFVWSDQK